MLYLDLAVLCCQRRNRIVGLCVFYRYRHIGGLHHEGNVYVTGAGDNILERIACCIVHVGGLSLLIGVRNAVALYIPAVCRNHCNHDLLALCYREIGGGIAVDGVVTTLGGILGHLYIKGLCLCVNGDFNVLCRHGKSIGIFARGLIIGLQLSLYHRCAAVHASDCHTGNQIVVLRLHSDLYLTVSGRGQGSVRCSLEVHRPVGIRYRDGLQMCIAVCRTLYGMCICLISCPNDSILPHLRGAGKDRTFALDDIPLLELISCSQKC